VADLGGTSPNAAAVAATPAGQSLRAAAVEEDKRRLYVSFTRARDLIVLARPQKKLDGGWMRTIGLAQRLPAEGARPLGAAAPVLAE
jgi:ATP-dependent exoDNAse (exonuclease V) beta subunit